MTDYPVDAILDSLRRALAGHTRVVLEAPPGAGKTTRVPPALLAEPWLAGQRILMLEPRRLAARAAAARMAALQGEVPGEGVGYRVRFESRVSAATRIEVVTEGILTRRLQQDPELDGVGLVIFDEFHERSLHSDLALALCRDVQRSLRPDLRLLLMSATLDGETLADRLGAARVRSEGRAFPVDVEYLPRDPDGPLAEVAAEATLRALAEHPQGDVLVFLPGAAPIRQAAKRLEVVLPASVSVQGLYGDLPLAAQAAAIAPAPAGRRKVVLATNIAETSLTIEGVRVVVDGGFRREARFDPRTGMTRLETVRIPRASAEQRAGRAGRLGPGHCYRLWSEATQRALVPFGQPEIANADLAPLALELAAWGARAADLAWLDPPPAGALSQGESLLQALGAVDAQGRITVTGRAMVRLPLPPRLAHLLHAAPPEAKATACDIAALLSERDVLRGERRACDFADRLEALVAYRGGGRTAAGRHGADPGACRQVERTAGQLRRQLGVDDQGPVTVIGPLLALAYPDRLAQARSEEPHRYLLANGRGARLEPGCPLAGAPYLVAAALDDRGQEARIQLAVAVEQGALEQLFAPDLEEADEVGWDPSAGRVSARRVRRFGRLLLSSHPLESPAQEAVTAALLSGLRAAGIERLPWNDAAGMFQARVEFLRAACPEQAWPDLSGAALATDLEDWLGPHLVGIRSLEALSRLDLSSILRSRLDWAQLKRLEAGAPERISVPSGHDRRIRYTLGESPVLAVKLQELFGLAQTPQLAWGRVPLTLELLSPAGRPVQVTRDLASFWARTYPEVRKELKGRYPKHPWPDDPWSAPATAGTRRR